MSRKLKLSFPASLSLLVLAGLSTPAAAQPAVLYEIVENIDFQKTMATGHRVSNWTAQGTAQANTPFCPSQTSCTITAFGSDDIGPSGTGSVWANIVAVANLDNPTDGPEFPIFSGQITGDVTIFSPNGGGFVMADLNKNKTVLGPMFPLIYVQNGKFWADGTPTVRTAPQFDAAGNYVVPGGEPTARFNSTFRLPFNIGKTGARERPEIGRNAYYLADNGSLIKVDKQDEFALGFPLLRAEVVFQQ
jgi:hypothetical protein